MRSRGRSTASVFALAVMSSRVGGVGILARLRWLDDHLGEAKLRAFLRRSGRTFLAAADDGGGGEVNVGKPSLQPACAPLGERAVQLGPTDPISMSDDRYARRCKRAREDRLQCFRDGRSLVLLRISEDAVLCRRSIGVSSGVTTRAGVHGSGGHPRTHVSSPSKNVRCSLRPGKPEVMRQTGFGKPCARKPSTRLAFGFLDPRSLLYYILLN